MKLKKILLSMVGVSGLFSLVSCGSGAESPTNSQNYGDNLNGLLYNHFLWHWFETS